MIVSADPEILQKTEHSIRLRQAQLASVLSEKARIAHEEGQIRMELMRLENDRYRLMTGREPPL